MNNPTRTVNNVNEHALARAYVRSQLSRRRGDTRRQGIGVIRFLVTQPVGGVRPSPIAAQQSQHQSSIYSCARSRGGFLFTVRYHNEVQLGSTATGR